MFIEDEEWDSTLRGVRAALRPAGRLVFESRDPAKKAWLEWNRDRSHRRIVIDGVGPLETWVELSDVQRDLVSFMTVEDIRDAPDRPGREFVFIARR